MQNSYLPPVKFMYLAGQSPVKLAEIDVRDVGPLVGYDNPDDICDLVVFLGTSCAACSDASGTYCLDTEITNLQGPVADTVVERITTPPSGC